MKFLTITKSKPIKLSVDTALKAGTPISITGKVANDDTAIGLVANDTAAGTESIAIVTEGMVDVNEIAASYGTALTDDCISALKGITFLHGGKAIVPAGGGGGGSGLPDYSEASDGDVLSIDNGEPAWKSGGLLLPDYSMEEPWSVLTLYGPVGSGVPPAWLPPQSGGPQVLYFNTDYSGDFYTNPALTSTISAETVYNTLIENPLAYCFYLSTDEFAPVFARPGYNMIEVTLQNANSSSEVEYLYCYFDIEYPNESNFNRFTVSGS